MSFQNFSPKFKVPASWNNLSRHNIWNDIVVPKLKKQKKKEKILLPLVRQCRPKRIKKNVHPLGRQCRPKRLNNWLTQRAKPYLFYQKAKKKTHLNTPSSSSSILHQHNQINTTFDTTITSKHQLHTHHCAQFV